MENTGIYIQEDDHLPLEERQQLADRCTEIIEEAEKEKRELTKSETKEFDENMNKLLAHRRQQGGVFMTRRQALEELKKPMNTGLNLWQAADDYPDIYRSSSENETMILERGQSMREFVSRHRDTNELRGLSAGAFLRAMVLGPRTDVERRALNGASDSAGGYTVPEILSSEIIDNMRAALVTERAGAKVIPLKSDQQAFAKILTDPIAAWRAENAAVNESDDITFGQVVFLPKTLACIVKASREVIEDSLNIEQALMMAITKSMAIEVDRVALVGSGVSPEPKGISETDGVNEVAMGTNGSELSNYDPLLNARGLCLINNAEEPRAYIMHPRTATELALIKNGEGVQLTRPDELKNIPFLTTTSIPIDDTHGSAVNASRIICGNFRDLWIGLRTQLRIELLKERYASNLQYGFLCFLRADIGVTRPASFAQITGIIPPVV